MSDYLKVDNSSQQRILGSVELNGILEPIVSDLHAFEQVLQEVLSSDSSIIYEISQHLLRKKGKRLRPAAVLLTARACGDEKLSGMGPAVAIELIHTATLLHDDVIDASEVRRGQDSVNHKWNNTVSVLMGDYLFAKAFKTLVEMKSASLYSVVSAATEKVSIGQLDEIREMKNSNLKEEQYLEIITNKTASLFAAACQAGCLSSHQGGAWETSLERFGEALGVAFQIADDLLDYTGDARQVGKEVGKDLAEGKVTLPLIHALKQAPPPEREETIDFLQNGFSPQGFNRILQFVERWGGLEYARRRAYWFAEQAWGYVESLPESQYKESLKDLVQFAVSRDR